MKEHLVEIFSKIKDPKSPNYSYQYNESITTDLLGSWLCISVIFRNPAIGSGSIFSRKYYIEDKNFTTKYRVLFMSDFLSHLLEQND